MLSAPRLYLTLLACLLAAPGLVLASSVTVNGTCKAGTCPPVDTLAPGSNVPVTDFSFATSVNGDPFDIFGEYSATNPPSGNTTIQFNATVVYEGTTPSKADLLTIDDLQDYTVTGGLSGTYFEDLAAGFGGTLGTGSSLSAQLSYNGDGIGELGPFTAPGYESLTKSLTLSGTSLAADFQFDFDFAAGAAKGAYITTTTPEPGGVIPIAVVLALCLGIGAVRRSHLSKSLG